MESGARRSVSGFLKRVCRVYHRDIVRLSCGNKKEVGLWWSWCCRDCCLFMSFSGNAGRFRTGMGRAGVHVPRARISIERVLPQKALRKTRALSAHSHVFLLRFCAILVHDPCHGYPCFRHSYQSFQHGFHWIRHSCIISECIPSKVIHSENLNFF